MTVHTNDVQAITEPSNTTPCPTPEWKRLCWQWHAAVNKIQRTWTYTTHKADLVFGTYTEDKGRIRRGIYYRIKTYAPSHTWLWWIPNEYQNFVQLPTWKNKYGGIIWVDGEEYAEHRAALHTEIKETRAAFEAAKKEAGIKF